MNEDQEAEAWYHCCPCCPPTCNARDRHDEPCLNCDAGAQPAAAAAP